MDMPPPFDKFPQHLATFGQTMGEVIQSLPPGEHKEMLSGAFAKWKEHLSQVGPALKQAAESLKQSAEQSQAMSQQIKEKCAAVRAKLAAAAEARTKKAQGLEEKPPPAPLAIDPAVGLSLREELLHTAGITAPRKEAHYGDLWDDIRKST
jgi:hypothetical protein